MALAEVTCNVPLGGGGEVEDPRAYPPTSPALWDRGGGSAATHSSLGLPRVLRPVLRRMQLLAACSAPSHLRMGAGWPKFRASEPPSLSFQSKQIAGTSMNAFDRPTAAAGSVLRFTAVADAMHAVLVRRADELAGCARAR